MPLVRTLLSLLVAAVALDAAASGAAAGVKMGSRGALLRLEVYENLGHSHTL